MSSASARACSIPTRATRRSWFSVARLACAPPVSTFSVHETTSPRPRCSPHTPVPAGHDRFALDLLERHFAHVPSGLGIEFVDFVAIVSRELLEPVYEQHELHANPITSITNGIHLPSWTSRPVLELLGVGEHERVQGHHFAERIDAVPSAALWQLRNDGRARLVAALRAQGLSADGFARRFASYKRAGLLLHDLDRLARLVADPERPLRVVFAGKAHPADKPAQRLIREVIEVCRNPRFAGRILFVPNYEIDVARMLLDGVDVWLNNPIRGQEASGTSGMKAAANGAINLSIADGWWPEAADGLNGWTFGGEREFVVPSEQDAADAVALHELLEREVLPAFFERDEAGIPTQWIERMRASMRTIPVVFNSDRMVREYLTRAYEPLAARATRSSRDRSADS